MSVNPDLEIAQIREVRMRISEEFHHDPDLLAQHYQELQKRHPDRLVDAPAVPDAQQIDESSIENDAPAIKVRE